MLSPNAMNRVALITGTSGTSVTENWQLAVRTPSVALQLTMVVPTGKLVPDAGLHVMVTGGVPPLAMGPAKVTTWVDPVTFSTRMFGGAVSSRLGTGGGGCWLGPLGLLPQLARIARATTASP
jgi:hypothetical protein